MGESGKFKEKRTWLGEKKSYIMELYPPIGEKKQKQKNLLFMISNRAYPIHQRRRVCCSKFQ